MKIIKIKPKEDQKYVQDFLALQEQKGITKVTLDQHRYALEHLFKKDFNLATLKDKLKENLPKSMSDSYFNKRLNTYRQFLDFLVEERVISVNYAKEWKYHKRVVKIVNIQDEDIQKFLSAIRRDTFSSVRYYVFSMLILGHATMAMMHVYINSNVNDTYEKHTRVSMINNFLERKIIKLKNFVFFKNLCYN